MEADVMGLAAFVVLANALEDLEQAHPGIKERAKAKAIASFGDPAAGNAPKIIEAIKVL